MPVYANDSLPEPAKIAWTAAETDGTVEPVAECPWGYTERSGTQCRDSSKPQAEWGDCHCPQSGRGEKP